MLIISRKSGSGESMVFAWQDPASKTLVMLGSFQVVKVRGDKARLGFEFPEAFKLCRSGPTVDGQNGQVWESVMDEKSQEGWTIVDDPTVVQGVVQTLLRQLPAALEEASA